MTPWAIKNAAKTSHTVESEYDDRLSSNVITLLMLKVNRPESTANPIGSAFIIKLKMIALNTEKIYQPLIGASM